MTTPVKDYFNSFLKHSFEGTEEQAVQELIESHQRQRTLISGYVQDYINSPEGQAWSEKVRKMSLDECVQWLAEVRST